MMGDEDDLSLVTTDAMLDELEKRFEVVLFAGVTPRERDFHQTMVRWDSENYLKAVGLAHFVAAKITQEYLSTRGPCSGDDAIEDDETESDE